MTGRERVKAIVAGEKPDRCGFWLGMPHSETWPIYLGHFGFSEQEKLRRFLHDDMRWFPADSAYKHPQGRQLFNAVRTGISEGAVPVFAECEDPDEVESHDWPNPDYLDFGPLLESLSGAGEVYRASGMWCCFFHTVADHFGMENYFVKMYTHPEVVDAVTRRVCEFYVEANERFFELAGDEVDCLFFGNDYGTQLDLMISPQAFDRFILPWTKKLIDQGHAHCYQVMHHCCGAIHKIIPEFVKAEVDALHPLQALARDMDAETLGRDFGGKIAFVGAIDTQDLLMRGTPEQVKSEVRRVKSLLGPHLVVSPSHEALLPNVPPENVLAMAEAARE